MKTLNEGRVSLDQDQQDELQRRRKALGLTQAQVAELLADTDYPLSRSHYSNIENGRHPLTPDQALAIDGLLGSQVAAHVEARTGASADRSSFAGLGEVARRIDRSFAVDRDQEGLMTSGDLGEWLTSSAEALIALTGRDPVRQATASLLGFATEQDKLQLREPVFLSHLPLTRRLPTDEEDRSFARALVAVLKSGWKVRQVIGREAGGSEADLVRSLCPFIASPDFLVRQHGAPAADALEGRIVIPGLASMQLFDIDDDGNYCQAVIYKDPQAVNAHLVLARQEFDRLTPFVLRHRRSEPDSTGIPQDEVDFREALVDASQISGDCAFAIGRLPTSSSPPDIYRKRIERRAEASSMVGDPVWGHLADLQAQRHAMLIDQLENPDGGTVRILVSLHELSQHVADERNATSTLSPTRTEQRQHIEEVLRLMTAFPDRFLLGFHKDEAVNTPVLSKWEVRQGEKGGTVIIQARFGHGANPVDIWIKKPALVHAYMAYFLTLWHDKTAVETDPVEVRSALEELATG